LVVFSGDEDDIVNAGKGAAGDVYVALDQWLGIDLAGHLEAGEFAEGAGVDIGADESGFVGIDAGAGQVVVIGKNVGSEEHSPLERLESGS